MIIRTLLELAQAEEDGKELQVQYTASSEWLKLNLGGQTVEVLRCRMEDGRVRTKPPKTYYRVVKDRITELEVLLSDVWYPLENYGNQVLQDEVIERVKAALENKG